MTPAAAGGQWTCPMHPEIVRNAPGDCPICGMALEPRVATLDDAVNPELVGMPRRFWVSAALSAPLLGLAMAEMALDVPGWLGVGVGAALATPVVL